VTPAAGKALWAATAFYAAALAAASLMPSRPGRGTAWDRPAPPAVQNASHVPAYAGLAVLFGGCVGAWSGGWRRAAWVAVGCVGYGAALELAQELVPGRTGSLSDAALDLAGVAAGVGGAMLWRRTMRRSAQGSA
jgi:VanZ family protein